MKRLLYLMALASTIGVVQAQNVSVKGVVVSSEDKTPIIGANVVVKGIKGVGTTTDVDGKFRLEMPKGSKALVVSYIGFASKEISPAPDMMVVLAPDSKLIDEVVVVAYGQAKKSSLTGSAVMLDKKQLAKTQVGDVGKALEGLAPGIQIANSNGEPGAATSIQIRGIGSMNASAAPLIIVDGAPYTGALNSINTADIENMSVLKDAASAALYGARGANGVILITTKKGREGRVSISFDARLGVNQRGVPEYDVISNPGEYYQTFWEALRNQYVYRSQKPLSLADAGQAASDELISSLGYNVYNVADNKVVSPDGTLTTAPIRYKDADWGNWSKALFEPQLRQEYNLSVTRGVKGNNIFFSAGYLDDKGYNITTGFSRISARLSYDTQILPWLKFSAGANLVQTKRLNRVNTGGEISNTFQWTRNIAPIYTVYEHDKDGNLLRDADGNLVYDEGRVYSIDGTQLHDVRAYASGSANLVQQQQVNRRSNKITQASQNARLDVTLPWGLKFNTSLAYNARWDNYSEFINPLFGDGKSYGGLQRKDIYHDNDLNWNQILSWDHTFGELSVSALVGHETFKSTNAALKAERTSLLMAQVQELRYGATLTDADSYTYKYNIEGYLGQLTANYKDRYNFSASLRRDGSSIFAPENRWGTFWSLGAGWILSKESFLRDVKAIDQLKLRVSYGAQGNDYLFLPTGYQDYRAYTPYLDLYEVSTDGSKLSITPKYKGNRDITWEKNYNLSVGTEFSLFKGRLTGEIDFFHRTTKDMLFDLPIPSTSGFSTKPVNFGSMRNVGWELSLNARLYSTDKVSVSLGFNATTFKNKILSLPDEFRQYGITKGSRLLIEGGSIYDYWTVHYAGVNPDNGDALFEKWNATEDAFEVVGSAKYSATRQDKQFVGSAIPNLMGGFNLNISAYGFDFSTQFAYRLGGLVNDVQYAGLMGAGSSGDNWHQDIAQRWKKEGDVTNVPRVQQANRDLLNASDRFFIKGDYLALRTINLGYTLPASLSKKLHLKSARIYVVADNVALWSRRRGLDPRTEFNGTQSTATAGAIRTISFGANVTL